MGWRDRRRGGYSALPCSDLVSIPLVAACKLILSLLLGSRKRHILAMLERKASSPPHPFPLKHHRTLKKKMSQFLVRE